MAQTLNALIYPHTPDVISELRWLDVTTIPEHKAAWWRPVIDDGQPAFNPALETCTSAHVIEAEHVAVEWTVTRRSTEAQHAAVNAERDNRIGVGFLFNTTLFQSRPEDQKRISGAATLAVIAIMAGAQPNDLRWHGGASDFAWIAADNSLVTMDAQTVLAFGQAAANWEAAHIYAARALKDLEAVPADYTDNQYWP